jgi:hypothetical protein
MRGGYRRDAPDLQVGVGDIRDHPVLTPVGGPSRRVTPSVS